ncbi:hypothetical protein EB796_010594 [Bugula neritina]|uniref:Uncharacterized protein n=1 Tax=Bugula neritina TaxID=10212 RepID=A0A7J7K0K8_BUGNE|nr:hypothetical protein EB796_010594 [Bugula neritina]
MVKHTREQQCVCAAKMLTMISSCSLNIQRQVGEIIEREFANPIRKSLTKSKSLDDHYYGDLTLKHQFPVRRVSIGQDGVLEATNKRPVMKYSHTMGGDRYPIARPPDRL